MALNAPHPCHTEQSLQVDRDVTLSEARLAREELRRTREAKIPQLQRRAQDFERAMAECRRECGELERRVAQTEVRVGVWSWCGVVVSLSSFVLTID